MTDTTATTVGIIYVAFGKECDRLAAHCIAYSRQYTKLPICVLTNMKHHNPKWNGIDDIQFLTFDAPVDDNRQFKTTMIDYAPYDFNIYMDADSIVQKDGFDEKMLQVAGDDCDLLFNHFAEYPYTDGKFQNIYLRALQQFGATIPLQIYNGAFIGFRKNDRVREFFRTWNNYWREFGKNREMPPLSCAVQKSNVRVSHLPKDFFCPDCRNDDSTVQHNYNQDFHKRVGCEALQLHPARYGMYDYSFSLPDADGRYPIPPQN